jgi:hypothetical protein
MNSGYLYDAYLRNLTEAHEPHLRGNWGVADETGAVPFAQCIVPGSKRPLESNDTTLT